MRVIVLETLGLVKFPDNLICANSATCLTLSGKVKLSLYIKNLKTLPPLPQPKHLKNCLSSLTVNDGVFS